MKDPTTLVVLVRHGQTTTTGKVLPGRAKGLHLSERGTAQAEAVAARLAKLSHAGRSPITAVYSSPLERTRETARPISRALGLRTRTSKALLECDFGDWTGRTLSALRKRPEWQQVQSHPAGFRFPNGESFSEMSMRMWGELERLAAAHRGETIVAVSHADPIKAAVATAAGVHLDLFQRLVISPCSVTPLLFTPQGPIVMAVNNTGDDISDLVPS